MCRADDLPAFLLQNFEGAFSESNCCADTQTQIVMLSHSANQVSRLDVTLPSSFALRAVMEIRRGNLRYSVFCGCCFWLLRFCHHQLGCIIEKKSYERKTATSRI